MKTLKTILAEATAHLVEDRYIDVIQSHIGHIHSKYGKNVRVQHGTSDVAGKYTSKIHEPSGPVHVSTNYDRHTYKVHGHIEESHHSEE